MHRKINLIFIIGVLFVSCQSKLDRSVSDNYYELLEAQDWHYKQVIDRGYQLIELEIQNRGLLPKEKEMANKLSRLFARFNDLYRLLQYGQEKTINDDFGFIEGINLNDSISAATASAINLWFEENGIGQELNPGSTAKEWLMFELKFREVSFGFLQKQLTKTLKTMRYPEMAYRQGDSVVLRELYQVFDEIEVNGEPIKIDSLGVFIVQKEGPLKVVVRKEQIADGFQALEDVVFEVR
jgi:hypothetical protein